MLAEPSVFSLNVVLGVLLVDILLSGDNAIVIALVCRTLPRHQHARVMWMGIAGALLARLVMTAVATMVMHLPLLKLVGGLLLLQIAISLIVDNVGHKEVPVDGTMAEGGGLWGAARTIILADIIMSLDNVLALSAVTQNHFPMLVFGLVLSIPILMFGSLYIEKLLNMFPVLLWAGSAILGGVAGGLVIDDPIFEGMFSADSTVAHSVVPVLVAAFVVLISREVLRNQPLVQNRPAPPSLWQIVRGTAGDKSVEYSAGASVAVPATPPSGAVSAEAALGAMRKTESNPEADAESVSSATELPQPVADAVAVRRDYRVVALLLSFMALTGWAIYAMVTAEPPPLPDRLEAYVCKAPPVQLHYRPSAGVLRLTSARGVAQAHVADGHISWANADAAEKVLQIKLPQSLLSDDVGQLTLQGGDFHSAVCNDANGVAGY